jgi:hypothetical protein
MIEQTQIPDHYIRLAKNQLLVERFGKVNLLKNSKIIIYLNYS